MTGNERDADKRHEGPSDPAHQGAKPAVPGGVTWFAPDPATGAARLGPNAAMSACLARNWWAIALRGAFAFIFGIVAVLLPGVTIGALVLLFAAYMLVDGIFAIIAGIRAASRHERWGMLILEGVADLIASAIAFFWPLATVLAFVFLAAAWAIVTGVMLLSAAFRLHGTHGRWLMGLGGVVSLIWGALLAFEPVPGAIALSWWLGAYALFFGGALIALAFRLRARCPPPAADGPARSALA